MRESEWEEESERGGGRKRESVSWGEWRGRVRGEGSTGGKHNLSSWATGGVSSAGHSHVHVHVLITCCSVSTHYCCNPQTDDRSWRREGSDDVMMWCHMVSCDPPPSLVLQLCHRVVLTLLPCPQVIPLSSSWLGSSQLGQLVPEGYK